LGEGALNGRIEIETGKGLPCGVALLHASSLPYILNDAGCFLSNDPHFDTFYKSIHSPVDEIAEWLNHTFNMSVKY